MTESSEASPEVVPQVLSEFLRQLATGRMILVVGDVASGAGVSGSPPYGGTELTRRLLSSVSPTAALGEAGVSVSEALRFARSVDDEKAQAVLRDSLRASHVEQGLKDLVSAPWERIYDLMGNGAVEAALRQNPPRDLVVTDATQEYKLNRRGLQLIRMAGSDESAARIDFSPPTASSPTARSAWYRQMCADLVTRPVLIASRNSYAELWEYLAGRRLDDVKPDTVSDAFYLAPGVLPVADVLRAHTCALQLLSGDVGDFASKVLISSRFEVTAGHTALARTRSHTGSPTGARLVSHLVRDAGQAEWHFLRGHDPQWADVVEGRVVRLSRMKHLWAELSLEERHRNVLVLKGRAGSGKTALLMRLAYEVEQKGHVVAWLDRNAQAKLEQVAAQVEALDPDVICLDDVDIFGERAGALLRRLHASGRRLIIASVRTTQSWTLEGADGLRFVDGDQPLTDHDLEGLLAALRSAGLLGSLLGVQPESARLERLRRLSERDLLAALIEVVTGEPFEKRVASEYLQLGVRERDAYALSCFFMSRVYQSVDLPLDDLLQMLGAYPSYAKALQPIKLLIDGRLLVQHQDGLRVRHRAVADAVIRSILVRDKTLVSQLVQTMLGFYAQRASAIREHSHPDRRHMVALLSHTLMADLALPREDVRKIYANVQGLLDEDFHFWLQRGAFEVERGDLDLADAYLESARACPGGERDYKVTTEWGLMRLVRARKRPSDGDAQAKAVLALSALESIARQHGRNSPHTFTVAVREGIAWLEAKPTLGDIQEEEVLRKIVEIRNLGELVCNDNREFMRTWRESKRALSNLSEGARPRFPLL